MTDDSLVKVPIAHRPVTEQVHDLLRDVTLTTDEGERLHALIAQRVRPAIIRRTPVGGRA